MDSRIAWRIWMDKKVKVVKLISYICLTIVIRCTPVALPSINRGVSYSFGVSYIAYNIQSFQNEKNSRIWGMGTIRYGVPAVGKYIGYSIGYIQYIPWDINTDKNMVLQLHDILSYGFIDLQLQLPYKYFDISSYTKFVYGLPVEISFGGGKEFKYLYPYVYTGWIYNHGLFLSSGIEIKIRKHFSIVIQPALFYEKIEFFKENRINYSLSGFFYFH